MTDTSPALTRLPERNLDVLRAVAVTCVVGLHLMIALGAAPSPLDFVGRAGVLFFFIHTSCVLMSSLERQKASNAGGLGAFYLRRACRIYPLSLATIALVLAFRIPAYVPSPYKTVAFVAPSSHDLVANVLLIQNLSGAENLLSVLWTLPIELQMYLMLPFLFQVIVRPRSWRSLAVLYAVSLCLGMVYLNSALPGLWRLSVLAFAPCFLVGVALFARLRTRPAPRFSGWTMLPLLGIGLAALRLSWEAPGPVIGSWITCLIVGLPLASIRELPPSWLTRASHEIAKYSYGIYLLHVPMLWLAFVQLPTGPTAVRVSVFVVTLGLASWLAYQLIEFPGIRWGQTLLHRRLTAAATAPAP